jgi:hypothetical protein
MAEQMMQMGIIKEPTQYFQVLNTGRIDVMFEGEVSQQLLVRQENEWLSEGKNPITAPTDIHAFHIQEHRSVLDDTDIRTDVNTVKTVMDHIQQHMDALQNTDPRLLALTGQQPIPPPGQPLPGQQGAPPAGPQGPAPQGPPQQQGPSHHGKHAPHPMASPQSPPMVKGMPKTPTVKASLLPNPAAQESSLGNVSNK